MSGEPAGSSGVEGGGDPAGGATKKILDLDIDQLVKTDVVVKSMDVEVTSVSKQESTVGHSPAAIFVITQEMIRRSGATSIPEALRMVPGLEVARIDANKWAITSRGFNGRFANKLLVLIDGRSVYTPLFSGVYWDVQDTLLEDIDRIEVIRGPGATVWGANAVNGVINIITRRAKDTQGVLATVGGGSQERDFASVRYGGKVGDGLQYRAYGKYFNRGPEFASYGANDAWRLGQGGFRMDWDLDPCKTDTVTFQGDYYDGHAEATTIEPLFPDPLGNFEQTIRKRFPLEGANLLTRWTHTLGEDSDYSLQFYYDRLSRLDPALLIGQDTYDVDFQHRFPWSSRQHIIWGCGYRWVSDRVTNSSWLALHPSARQTNLASAFVQDEIALVEDRLLFTAGCKFEKNDFTGFEYQPSARLLWLVSKRSSAWAAVSRAVRTPSLAEQDAEIVQLPIMPGVPLFPLLFGNRDLKSEAMLGYELGYRAQATDDFSWDLALFVNRYEDLRTLNPFVDPSLPPIFIPFRAGNDMRGETYGVELAAQWDLTEHWRLRGHYTYLQMQLHAAPGTAPNSEMDEGSNPHNQVYLMSSWDLARHLEFDVTARYVDSLPALGVHEYIDMDLRLGWRPTKNLEMAVVGQNLLENHVLQFNGAQFVPDQPTEVKRGVYGKVTWRY